MSRPAKPPSSVASMNSALWICSSTTRGIFPTSPVLEMSPEFFDLVLSVNLKGLFYMSKAAGLQMVKQGRGGKIVNIASIDSCAPSMQGLAAYDSSKGGVLSFTKNFALEMAPHNVNVNAIAPGGITTEGASQPLVGISAADHDGRVHAADPPQAHGRAGRHRQGRAVPRIARPADYMTGALIVVDGGMLLS